ncbi:hypothetical protein [Brachybacterium sacelli]|uniref:Flp pilus assembly protein protease CpaA n=1 Tax=Brachybacterium sacelli TaxID=173364 RepID=A0ABS4WWU9_9MICO|nr:hypothetical protein [Brachybacterium sacelli]MBP2380682.1 Flp pilus assembly protein protease CpaA [Brachybacterium sacelli]
MFLFTPALWPALLAFLALATPLAIKDAREFRLPLPLNLGLLGSALVLLPIASIWTGAGPLLTAAITGGVVTVLLLGLFILARGGLGFGDVILGTGLGLYGGFVSPLALLAGLWIGCLGTLIWAVLRKRRGVRGSVPFGPGLILGTALVLVVPVPGLT